MTSQRGAPPERALRRFPRLHLPSPLPRRNRALAFHRYLISFDARKRPTCSPTCWSSGRHRRAAGGARRPADLGVLVVTKDRMKESNSSYAQGGIAGVLSPEDRFENHIDDTLVAGDGLCDREVVEMVVREAPAQIEELIEWGTKFDLENGAPRPDPRGRPQPPADRPRPGRRHRPRGHAGDHRAGASPRRTSSSGTTPSPSTCSPTTGRASGPSSGSRAPARCSSGRSR